MPSPKLIAAYSQKFEAPCYTLAAHTYANEIEALVWTRQLTPVSTVDSAYMILFGTQDLGSIFYHLYGNLMGYLMRSDFAPETMIWDPQQKYVIGQSILYRTVL